MKNIFEKAFLKSLNEQAPLALGAGDDMSDSEAMTSTLDAGTKPTDFDVHAKSREAMQNQAAAQSAMINKLEEWIQRIAEFSNFLNDPKGDSIQAILNSAVPETIMDKIRTSESKRIARVASELGALNEMMKGYLNTRDDAKYRGV